MTGMFDLYIILLIFVSLKLAAFVDGVVENAENVCPVEEETEELNLQRHEQTVVLHTTEACWDIRQGFRCKVVNNGTKVSYKGVPRKKKIIVYRCCHGYFETSQGTCQICPEGYYGNNCVLRCNCSGSEICDNVVGCCDSSKKQCRNVLQSDALRQVTSTRNLLFPVLMASFLAVALLSFGTIFYRKKYIKEKDPDLPTLTYRPDVKNFLQSNEIESREFNNPLYRQSAIDDIDMKKHSDESLPIAGQFASNTNMNDYATLDYAIPTLTEPSSSYEVPLRQSLPSPIARANENKLNEGKEAI